MGADPTTWAVAVLAVMISGVSKGGFGAGVGFIATPLMALVISPALAAGVMLPILIMMDHMGLVAYWRKWRWATVWPALLAALAGIAIGALLFGKVDADALRLGLGLISLTFTAFLIARMLGWSPAAIFGRGLRACVWGGTSGFTSMISHAGGPPITMYLLRENLAKTEYQACTVLLFWAINLAKLAPYALLGAVDLSTAGISAMLAPAAGAGILLGVWLHRRVPERIFFRAMIVLLTLTALKLVWDGAGGLLG